jgi:hypothetical protein
MEDSEIGKGSLENGDWKLQWIWGLVHFQMFILIEAELLFRDGGFRASGLILL